MALRLEGIPGESIGAAVERTLVEIRKSGGLHGYLVFGGIELVISHDSNPYDIITIWELKTTLMGTKINMN
jgi:hypothetical protein